jgi:hypothetical protein
MAAAPVAMANLNILDGIIVYSLGTDHSGAMAGLHASKCVQVKLPGWPMRCTGRKDASIM